MFREYALAIALAIVIVGALVTVPIGAEDLSASTLCMEGIYNKVIENVPLRAIPISEIVHVNVNVTVKVTMEGNSAKIEATALLEPAEPGNATISYSMPFMDMVVQTLEGKVYRWSEGKVFIMAIMSRTLPLKESISMTVNASCITGVTVYVRPLDLKIEFGGDAGFEPTLTQTSVQPINTLTEKTNITKIIVVLNEWPKPGNATLVIIPMPTTVEEVPNEEGSHNYTIACPPDLIKLVTNLTNETIIIRLDENISETIIKYTGYPLAILIPLCTSRNAMYYIVNEKELGNVLGELEVEGMSNIIYMYNMSSINTANSTSPSTFGVTAAGSETTTTVTEPTSVTYATVTTLTVTETATVGGLTQPESSVKYTAEESLTTGVKFDEGVKIMPVSYTALLLGVAAAILVGCVTFIVLRKL